MPVRKSTKNVRKPTKYRTRRTRRPRKTFSPSKTLTTYTNNLGLGRYRRATLTWRYTSVLAAAAGTPDSFAIMVNSCYDPLVAAGGHQPFGFDQLIALYKQYRVDGGKIQVRFTNSGTNTAPHICQVVLDNDSTINNTLNTRLERTKGLGSKLLLINSNNRKVITTPFSTRKFFNVKNTRDDHQLAGTSSTNPTLPIYGHVIVQCADNSSATTSGVLTEVLVTQYVTFFSPEEQNGS